MTPLRKLIAPAIVAALWASSLHAQSVPAKDAPESSWIEYIATRNEDLGVIKAEHRLPDESRVDIYTHDTVFEVERAAKWKESLGQAFFYRAMTGKKYGGVILLLLGDPTDKLYLLRCTIACREAGLRLVVVDAHGTVSWISSRHLSKE